MKYFNSKLAVSWIIALAISLLLTSCLFTDKKIRGGYEIVNDGAGSEDTTPETFSFVDKNDVSQVQMIDSNIVQITGISKPVGVRRRKSTIIDL